MQTLKLQLSRLWEIIRLRPRRLGWFSLTLVIAFAAVGFLLLVFPSSAGVISWLGDKTLAAFVGAVSFIARGLADICFSLAAFFVGLLIQIASYNNYLDVKAIEVGWVMVRDIGNIFLVVALLIIAIATIVGVESYEWKKMLTKFVMAAILVNFSRQICAFIIDAAQVVTMTFVNGVASAITSNIINSFNLGKLWSVSPGGDPEDTTDIMKQLTTNIMTLIMAVVLCVTLGVYALIFVARMVMLWVLITLSPLAFFLSVLPQTQKYASQWWSEFINNVIMGPVIMFFFWLSLVTISGGNIDSSVASGSAFPMTQGDINQGVAPPSSGITDFLQWDTMSSFVIAIGMLLAGVKVGQQIGGAGAGAMSNISGAAKKSMMMLSGASAAMWAGKKGMDLGKKGAAAVGGFVGKQALQRTGLSAVGSRIQRRWRKGDLFGKTLGKNLGLGEYGIEKDGEKIKKIADMKPGWRKSLAQARMNMTASTTYLNKRDEKQKARAEMQKTRNERLLSTSSTDWGEAELDESMALEDIEAHGMGIKTGKEANRRKNIATGDQMLAQLKAESMAKVKAEMKEREAAGETLPESMKKEILDNEKNRDITQEEMSKALDARGDIPEEDKAAIMRMYSTRALTTGMGGRQEKGMTEKAKGAIYTKQREGTEGVVQGVGMMKAAGGQEAMTQYQNLLSTVNQKQEALKNAKTDEEKVQLNIELNEANKALEKHAEKNSLLQGMFNAENMAAQAEVFKGTFDAAQKLVGGIAKEQLATGTTKAAISYQATDKNMIAAQQAGKQIEDKLARKREYDVLREIATLLENGKKESGYNDGMQEADEEKAYGDEVLGESQALAQQAEMMKDYDIKVRELQSKLHQVAPAAPGSEPEELSEDDLAENQEIMDQLKSMAALRARGETYDTLSQKAKDTRATANDLYNSSNDKRKAAEQALRNANPFYARQQSAASYQVLGEEEKLERDQQLLYSKAQAYEDGGNVVKANAVRSQAANQRIKVDNDLYSNLNYTERMALEEQLTKEMAQLVQGTDEFNKKLRQKTALASYNSSVDAESSRDSTIRSLQNTDWYKKEPNGGVIDDDNRLRALLTQHTGAYVEAGGEQAAIEKWKKAFKTPDEQQAALKMLSANLKKAGGGGDLKKLGLINEDVNSITGKLDFSWKTKPDNSDRTFSKYWVPRVKNADKVTSFGNIDRNGNLAGFSERGIKDLGVYYKGKDSRALSDDKDQSFKASWNDATVNIGNFESLVRGIASVKGAVKDDQAYTAFKSSITELTAKLEKVAQSDQKLAKRLKDVLDKKPT